MTNREHRFLDLIRSAVSWFLVALVTFLFFFLMAIYFLLFFAFDRPRKGIHPIASFWARTILLVCPVMKVRWEGADRLKENETYVLIANHQSLADVLAVLHLAHSFKFIAKRELFWIPFFGWSLSLAGYIPLIRGDHKSGKEALERARYYLKRGVSVLFFPEGTRSPNGEIQAFKVGAFKLASEIGVPVVPLVIDGTRNLLPKGSRLIGRSVQVTVNVEASHQPKGQDPASIQAFVEEVRLRMINRLSSLRGRPTDGPDEAIPALPAGRSEIASLRSQ
jgi:1-acyl-sn-glycerol-3-phosphate acyltransferase